VIEQLSLGTAFFVAAVAAVYSVHMMSLKRMKARDNARDHALGRERLDLLLSAARNAGFMITEGDFKSLGTPTKFTLMREAGNLRYRLEITQTLDEVDIWFTALGAGHEVVKKEPKSFSEAIWVERLLREAEQIWDTRKAEKLVAAAE